MKKSKKHCNSDHADVFEDDAINGERTGLSWTKMRYEMDLQMPRTRKDVG